MRTTHIMTALTIACSSLSLASCDEPASPGGVEARGARASATRETEVLRATAAAVTGDPFAVRGTLDPFFINQAPEFMMRSSIPSEIVIQRLTTSPTPSAWHTHPGPIFAKVEVGRVTIQRYVKGVCLTQTYEEGQTYIEVANDVHRASGEGPTASGALEYKVRFIPAGAPLSTPLDAADIPAC